MLKARKLTYILAIGDITAPNLSSPTATETGSSTATLSVTSDEADGTLYWVVTTSATLPSAAQVLAGDNNSGTAAVASGSQPVSATGTQSVSATGLTASTTYYAYFMQKDAAGNPSTVEASASFTTAAASGLATPTLTNYSDLGTTPVVLLTETTDDGTVDYAGYRIQWEVSPDGAKNGDGSYTTVSQSGVFFIDGESFANGECHIGLTDPSGEYFAHVRILRDNEAGSTTVTDENGSTFTCDASAWSNDFTDTIEISVAALTTATGTSKSKYLNVNGSYQAVVNANVNNYILDRLTLAATNAKFWVEQQIDGSHTGNDGSILLSLMDDTTDLNAAGTGFIPNRPGTSTQTGMTVNCLVGSTTVSLLYNGTSHPITLPGSNVTAVGDIVGLAVDTTANTIAVFYHSAANGDLGQLGSTITLTSLIPDSYNLASGGKRGTGTVASSDASTLHIKPSDWVMTPPTGYENYYA